MIFIFKSLLSSSYSCSINCEYNVISINSKILTKMMRKTVSQFQQSSSVDRWPDPVHTMALLPLSPGQSPPSVENTATAKQGENSRKQEVSFSYVLQETWRSRWTLEDPEMCTSVLYCTVQQYCNPILDTRISVCPPFVLRLSSVCPPFVTLRGPPLFLEMGRTRELWSNCVFLTLEN